MALFLITKNTKLSPQVCKPAGFGRSMLIYTKEPSPELMLNATFLCHVTGYFTAK